MEKSGRRKREKGIRNKRKRRTINHRKSIFVAGSKKKLLPSTDPKFGSQRAKIPGGKDEGGKKYRLFVIVC